MRALKLKLKATLMVEEWDTPNQRYERRGHGVWWLFSESARRWLPLPGYMAERCEDERSTILFLNRSDQGTNVVPIGLTNKDTKK